jgi:hypothetical protein
MDEVPLMKRYFLFGFPLELLAILGLFGLALLAIVFVTVKNSQNQ